MDCLTKYELTSYSCSHDLQDLLNYVRSLPGGTTVTSQKDREMLTSCIANLLSSQRDILEKFSSGEKTETTSTSFITVSIPRGDADVGSEMMHLFLPELRSSTDGKEQLQQCQISTGSMYCYTSMCKRGMAADKFGLEEPLKDYLIQLKLYDGKVASQDTKQYWKGKVVDLMVTANRGMQIMNHVNSLIRDANRSLQEKGATRQQSRARFFPY
ncbi:uncharacterized protein LOC126470451 isoform X1 [Schistocerca serialis cubense]|uniref:uncharacterized protein LOC126470451 isoform X1 n=1 Tax=Schistocerca serialis cubense TaxID=2023355 RepID=UPI00214DFA12|nr:uncharacterized protein LOC126470451 isoform X1 [Schistocerca serialis cubense]XP_049954254.1 uncharacterized protein LOC126470451 isoform X1 [Schistocerca serialis cubense]XP_049954255.1 uncharacterized protein LOC126470451 isoform X1 [Schistocerca serialis cubense]